MHVILSLLFAENDHSMMLIGVGYLEQVVVGNLLGDA